LKLSKKWNNQGKSEKEYLMKKFSKDTDIVHGIHTTYSTSMDLVPPLHLTSTFKFRNADHGAEIFAGTTEGYATQELPIPRWICFRKR